MLFNFTIRFVYRDRAFILLKSVFFNFSVINSPFRLENELNYTAIKDIRNTFRLEKKTTKIKDKKLRDIKNLFEYGKE